MILSHSHLMIENMSYRVGPHLLLDDINLHSSADLCTALVGANGSGKTTLLKICHGLLTPVDGTVRWGERTPLAMGRRIAFVFQKPRLLHRSVRANMNYVLALHGVEKAQREARVMAALAMVGLEDKIKRDVRLLSGGEQQRLALARAWVVNPEVILLDEPTSGLDLRTLEKVEGIIAGFQQQGVKVIFSSHHLSQVRRLADEVVFLSQGKCMIQSEVDDFFNASQIREVCEFIRLQALS